MLDLLFLPVQLSIDLINHITNDYGIAIIIFSILLYFVLTPLRSWAFKVQNREILKQQAVQPKIEKITQNFKGEERHKQLELLYQEENYSPFSPIKQLIGLSTQIPLLLLIYYSLLDYEALQNQSFLSLIPLDRTDSLIVLSSTFFINLLPLLMWSFGIISSLLLKPTDGIQPKTIQQQKKKGIFINTVFLILLYSQPAAVVLYWTTNVFLDMSKKIFDK
jgi:YidC/Oxa1 family membrane protein insertase